MQAGFKADQVQVAGRFSDYARISDEADRKEHVFHFCPDCGSQVFYTEPTEPDLVVVSVGSFADPSFPPPTESGYDSRRHPWVGLPDSIQRHAPELWDPVRPLYEAGRYAEAADRGRELIEAHPDQGVPLLQRRLLREPRRPDRRRRRAPAPGDRHLGAAAATWRPRTPTSTRSGTSPLPGTGRRLTPTFLLNQNLAGLAQPFPCADDVRPVRRKQRRLELELGHDE